MVAGAQSPTEPGLQSASAHLRTVSDDRGGAARPDQTERL